VNDGGLKVETGIEGALEKGKEKLGTCGRFSKIEGGK